jgi:hypothetical protein
MGLDGERLIDDGMRKGMIREEGSVRKREGGSEWERGVD